mgnify:CR=1 FL=1
MDASVKANRCNLSRVASFIPSSAYLDEHLFEGVTTGG